jgi:hypothetical protein
LLRCDEARRVVANIAKLPEARSTTPAARVMPRMPALISGPGDTGTAHADPARLMRKEAS